MFTNVALQRYIQSLMENISYTLIPECTSTVVLFKPGWEGTDKHTRKNEKAKCLGSWLSLVMLTVAQEKKVTETRLSFTFWLD